jgi:hypothetical protein
MSVVKELVVDDSLERKTIIKQEVIEPDFVPFSIDSTKTYNQIKKEVKQSVSHFKKNPVSTDSINKLFCHLLVERIFPYWVGTTWSFEGHTNTPNSGEIACGYFVSTTLQHVGMNLNRYDLAKKSPIDEARFLQMSDSITTIENDSLNQIITQLYSLTQPGIYFLGFENSHVGFLYRTKNNLWVIHSDPSSADGPKIEAIESSDYFSYFRTFHIVPISGNKRLMQYWIQSKEIK